MNTEQCSACKNTTPSSTGVFVQIKQDYHFYCLNCYNDKMAEQLGLDFQNISLSPVTLKDTDNLPHTFFFQTRLLGYKVIIETKEHLNDDKQVYEFSVLGNVDDDLFDLFKILFEKIRRALSQKHIEPCHINQYRMTHPDTVRDRQEVLC
jgi:hypothetical protein